MFRVENLCSVYPRINQLSGFLKLIYRIKKLSLKVAISRYRDQALYDQRYILYSSFDMSIHYTGLPTKNEILMTTHKLDTLA